MMVGKKILAMMGTVICAVEMLGSSSMVDEVLLTNGTKLRGIISAQYVKEQKITFTSYESEFVFPKSQIYNQNNNKVTIKGLPEGWRMWIKEHPEYVVGDSIVLSSVSLQVNNETKMDLPIHLDSILVLPASSTDVKIIDFSERKINVNLSTVKIMNKIYDNGSSSEIKEIIDMSDGKSYMGRTLSQVPGKYISFMSDDGVVSLYYKDIRSLSYESSKSDLSINAISEYVETIEEVSGARHEGVIIKKSYGDGNTPSFILIKSPNKVEPYYVQNKDVKVIYKEINGKGNSIKTTSQIYNPVSNTTENKSNEDAVTAINQGVTGSDNRPFVEVNGIRCNLEPIESKGNKYILPLSDNIVTFQNSEIEGKICISQAGGNLIKFEGGRTNMFIIKKDDVSNRSLPTENEYIIGKGDFKPEYYLEPGIYVYILGGESCIVIEIL